MFLGNFSEIVHCGKHNQKGLGFGVFFPPLTNLSRKSSVFAEIWVTVETSSQMTV